MPLSNSSTIAESDTLLVKDEVAPLTVEAVRLANLSFVVFAAMKFLICTKVSRDAGAIKRKQMNKLIEHVMYYTAGSLQPT